MSKELKFEYMNYWNVDIFLRDRITELSGNTATGKSFIYSVIEDYVEENKIQDIKCLDKSIYSKLDKSEILNKLNRNEVDGVIFVTHYNHSVEKLQNKTWINEENDEEDVCVDDKSAMKDWFEHE